MTTTYYNPSNDLIVKVTGDEFVIIGDDTGVTDAEILSMSEDNTPEGWQRS